MPLGVAAETIHLDHGLTGTNRTRPGLREAMAAVRSGGTLVVTKLDRLARSLPDARDIADERDTDADHVRSNVLRWRSTRAASDGIYQEDSMANVTVDPDIFNSQGEPYLEPLDGWWGPSPFFLVISDEIDKAAEALHVAIGRCMRVDGNGNELTAAQMATTGEYTANYCSPVYLTERGPLAYLDTNGELPRAMAETMLRILVEEVEARGITAYLTTPPRGSESTAGYPVWEDTEAGIARVTLDRAMMDPDWPPPGAR